MVSALPLVERPDLNGQMEALEKEGYVYFPSVLSGGEIEELRARIDSLDPVEANFDSYSTPDELVYGNFQGGGFFLKHIKSAFNRVQ